MDFAIDSVSIHTAIFCIISSDPPFYTPCLNISAQRENPTENPPITQQARSTVKIQQL